jgi:translation elongation factor EF-4
MHPIGFLGMLHMDVFRERLENEYGVQALLTSPNVPYIVRLVHEP